MQQKIADGRDKVLQVADVNERARNIRVPLECVNKMKILFVAISHFDI
jgi:hypothetical protein